MNNYNIVIGVCLISLGQVFALIGFALVGSIILLLDVIHVSGLGFAAIFLLFAGLICILYGMLENAEIPKSR